MEPLKIKMLCDADFCNCSAGRRSRETTTIAECERLHRQVSGKGEVRDARNNADEQTS
jgi:hypothetical protein